MIEYSNGDAFKGKTDSKFEKISGDYISKGVVFSGEFENNEPKQGKLIYKNGEIYEFVVWGKVKWLRLCERKYVYFILSVIEDDEFQIFIFFHNGDLLYILVYMMYGW